MAKEMEVEGDPEVSHSAALRRVCCGLGARSGAPTHKRRVRRVPRPKGHHKVCPGGFSKVKM